MKLSLLEVVELERLYDIAQKRALLSDVWTTDALRGIHAQKEGKTVNFSNDETKWFIRSLLSSVLIIGQIQGIREERRRRRENLKHTDVTEIIHF